MVKVLVVDDEPQVRGAIADTLARAGFDVATARNGRLAVELLRDWDADLVITDIVMPEQDGIATILALRRFARPPKIIAVSEAGGGARGTYLKWALKLGADEVMAKPVQAGTLVATIRRVLAGGEVAELPLPPQLEFDFDRRLSA